MKKKLFYRVADLQTQQGLWYDMKGNFTGLIHDKFSFCLNTKLPMPYDPNIVGWLSVTETLEDLFNWFTIEDIQRLETFGYAIVVYSATEYKFHTNHWVINQDISVLERVIYTSELTTLNASILNNAHK